MFHFLNNSSSRIHFHLNKFKLYSSNLIADWLIKTYICCIMKMKTGIVAILLGLGASSAALCQSQDNSQVDYVNPISLNASATNVPTTFLSMGLGMGGYYPYTGAAYVENPTISLMCDHTVVKRLGPGKLNMGGIMAYTSIYSNYTDYYTNYDYEQRWNYYIFGGRVTYNVQPFSGKNMDMYAGVMAAYYITTFSFASDDPNYAEPSDPGYSLKYGQASNFFSPGVFVGFRTWLNTHSSLWAEAGYGYTTFNFGVSYRI